MGFFDDTDRGVRFAALGLALGGVGIGTYRAFREIGATGKSLVSKITPFTGTGMELFEGRFRSGTDIEKGLEQAISASKSVMGSEGLRETLRRTYTGAFYSTRRVEEATIASKVESLLSKGTDWETVRKVIGEEVGLGGAESVYQAMRVETSATRAKFRGKSVAESIWQLASEGQSKSSFAPQGKWWQQLFGGVGTEMSPGRIAGLGRPFVGRVEELRAALESQLDASLNLKVTAGTRDLSRSREFFPGVFKEFKGSKGEVLPFAELRIGGSKSKKIIRLPFLAEETALSGEVIENFRGMRTASVPHFSIPKAGGGYEVVNINRALEYAMVGNPHPSVFAADFKNLATRINEEASAGRSINRVINQFESVFRGQMEIMTGTAGSRIKGLATQASVIPVDWLMGGGFPGTAGVSTIGMEKLEEFAKSMEESGHRVFALGSPSATAESGKFFLKPLHEEWDVFGRFYSAEQRPLQRLRPFEMTPRAREAMMKKPIMGIINRGTPLYATDTMRAVIAEGYQYPSLLTVYALKGSQDLSKEEALLSRKVRKMLETRVIESHRVHTSRGFVKVGDITKSIKQKGQFLEEGALVGYSYETGLPIFSRSRKGMLYERIIKAETYGDETLLQMERVFPMQRSAKIFGALKATMRRARGGLRKEAVKWGLIPSGPHDSVLSQFIERADMLVHASTLKKSQAEIYKQMSEAYYALNVAKNPKMATAPQFDTEMRNIIAQLAKEEEPGIAILRQAAKAGFTEAEMGLVGGIYMQQYIPEAERAAQITKLKAAGVADIQIEAMMKTTAAIGLPTPYFGDYPLYQPHRGGTMDPRGLREIYHQDWPLTKSGESPGKLLIEEIMRRSTPTQDLSELEKAMVSLAHGELPSDIKTVTTAREAADLLEKEGFIFKAGEKSVYVPGPPATRMGKFYPGGDKEVVSEQLRGAYESFFKSADKAREWETKANLEKVEASYQNLMGEVESQFQVARSPRGKTRGTESLVTTTWREKSRTFPSIEEFTRATPTGEVWGIGRAPGERLFEEIIKDVGTSKAEKEFAKAQKALFLAGEEVTAFAWRSPQIYTGSQTPIKLQMVKGGGENIFVPKMQIIEALSGGKQKVLDVSIATAMKLDHDFDHAVVGVIANEKTKKAVDELLRNPTWRRGKAESAEQFAELLELTRKAGGVGDEGLSRFSTGLRRLVGATVLTPEVSTAVEQIRFASAFAKVDEKEYMRASNLLSVLEEAPIGSKKAVHAERLAENIKLFASGQGIPRQELTEAWVKAFGAEDFMVGNKQYKMQESIDMFVRHMTAAEASSEFAGFKNGIRRMAAASKGRKLALPSAEKLGQIIKSYERGQGDVLSSLVRAMRKGAPGTALEASRTASSRAGALAKAGFEGLKKHWRYPALGIGAAVGLSWLSGSSELKMPEPRHDQAASNLAMGGQTGQIPPPRPLGNRIVTSGNTYTPSGYNVSMNRDLNFNDRQMMGAFANGGGSSVQLRDDRGSITPEYIRKIQTERYY